MKTNCRKSHRQTLGLVLILMSLAACAKEMDKASITEQTRKPVAADDRKDKSVLGIWKVVAGKVDSKKGSGNSENQTLNTKVIEAWVKERYPLDDLIEKDDLEIIEDKGDEYSLVLYSSKSKKAGPYFPNDYRELQFKHEFRSLLIRSLQQGGLRLNVGESESYLLLKDHKSGCEISQAISASHAKSSDDRLQGSFKLALKFKNFELEASKECNALFKRVASLLDSIEVQKSDPTQSRTEIVGKDAKKIVLRDYLPQQLRQFGLVFLLQGQDGDAEKGDAAELTGRYQRSGNKLKIKGQLKIDGNKANYPTLTLDLVR